MTKRQIIFQCFMMAIIMSGCMSFVMTAVSIGFVPHLFSAFVHRWPIGFIVALPISFIVPPFIQKLIQILKI